ncbi:MAG: methyltransferase, TrmH family [Frankiales bacterium]|nr:methyltransferase, TrmH family [Frankiales bacterium]
MREALAHPDRPVREVFATAAALERHRDLRLDAERTGIVVTVIDDRVLAQLSDSVSPQGLVAVVAVLAADLSTVLKTDPRLVVVLADVRDPGNAGSVIRVADAAGADAVVLTRGSVDPWGGKAVRASAGSVFHLPVITGLETGEVVRVLQKAGLAVLAADGGGALGLDVADEQGLLAQRTAWLFGNEAWGLPPEIAGLADQVVAVPIHGRAESLNLATAAAVCLYASAGAQRKA